MLARLSAVGSLPVAAQMSATSIENPVPSLYIHHKIQ
jgi:hypothetical protein